MKCALKIVEAQQNEPYWCSKEPQRRIGAHLRTFADHFHKSIMCCPQALLHIRLALFLVTPVHLEHFIIETSYNVAPSSDSRCKTVKYEGNQDIRLKCAKCSLFFLEL